MHTRARDRRRGFARMGGHVEQSQYLARLGRALGRNREIHRQCLAPVGCGFAGTNAQNRWPYVHASGSISAASHVNPVAGEQAGDLMVRDCGAWGKLDAVTNPGRLAASVRRNLLDTQDSDPVRHLAGQGILDGRGRNGVV